MTEPSRATPDLALDIRDLRKTYRGGDGQADKEALKGVTLGVPTGAIYGLLGPNGAGKSTLINIFAGLVTKTSGAVGIWGFDQDENPRMSRASIGVVPQELVLDPFFSPREAMEIQAGLYGIPKAKRRTMELLSALGLADKADAYARSLSGGMRRRLLIGKALAHRPPVLILDEPTAGVDIELRQQLWAYVRALHAEGMTIVLTTHYLEEAEEMCDRIAIINHGEVIADESKEALLSRIDRKNVTITAPAPLSGIPALLADDPDFESALRADGTLEISYSRSVTGLGRILERVRDSGIEIMDVTTAEGGLERIFLDLTRSGPD